MTKQELYTELDRLKRDLISQAHGLSYSQLREQMKLVDQLEQKAHSATGDDE